jgi:enterochelin esterase-like enzyme
MEYSMTRFIRHTVFCLSLLAALAACVPSNRPGATATPVATATLPASLPTSTLSPLPTRAPTPTQTTGCHTLPGQLLNGEIVTVLLAKPMTYRVYLPACYVEDQAQHYPVLYLLHGQTYNEDQWIRLGVPTTADRLIAAGQAAPFIVVFPYDYSYLQPWQYHFEEVFMQLLVPQIDATYRTLPDAAHRAVGGLSRGGAWALHLGIHHPDVFGAIGAHSPAIFYSDAGSLPLYLRDIPASQLPRIYLDAANNDSELPSSENIRQLLDRFKVPYEWHESAGFHDETYWGAHVEEYLRWYAQGWQSNP